jgi:conjugal transfer pilus assembly protein TraF
VRLLSLFALALLLAGSAYASGPIASKSSLDDIRRGWWWYEEDSPKKSDQPQEQKITKPSRVLPSLKDYTAEQLWNMHPDDYQPLIKEFLKKAVQTPTLENVREFYVLVDIARMKAHVFQNIAGAAWQKYPELSLNSEIPLSTYGRAVKSKMQRNEVIGKISSASQDFALIYFYAQNCDYCKAQDEVLDVFIREHGWEVKRVDINAHPDLAARFDVKMTPYLMLIYRGSMEFFPVSVGLSAVDEIEERIYRGIRLLSGENSPESYSLYEFERGGKMDPSVYMNKAGDDR